MATIRDVSHLAQVSKATVSRVINGSAPTSDAIRQRVLAAIEELNFQPDVLARALATRRSGGVGVTVNDIASPYYGAVLKGVERVVEAAGMHLLVSSGHAEEFAERKAVEFLQQRHADVLIVQVDATGEDQILAWAEQDVPLVLFGQYVPGMAERCVYLDNELGGYLATQHLIDNGHQRIAHISGPLSIKDSQARLQGYQRVLSTSGLEYDPSLLAEGNFQAEGGADATRQLLERGRDFSAIFVANDEMVAGVLHALYEAGLRVPQDISLVGYDDILFAQYLSPKLTTVRQPLLEMGEAAATLALALLEGKETEVRRKFEPELVIRQSVGPR